MELGRACVHRLELAHSPLSSTFHSVLLPLAHAASLVPVAATDRMPAGADEVAQSMREGDWRRMVIPAKLAYGEEGLRFGNSKVYAVSPNTDVFFDIRMVDGGSGRCDKILHPPGVSDKVSLRLKSISCVPGAP